MAWLIALFVITIGVVMIVAGVNGSGAQLYTSITGNGVKTAS